MCESCMNEKHSVVIKWPDGESFLVCGQCFAMGAEHGGEEDIRETIGQLRNWGKTVSWHGNERSVPH